MRDGIHVAGQLIRAGQRVRLQIPAARFATGSPLTIPVEVVHGRREGASLWLTAAVHGDELNGVEVVRRVLGRVDARTLRGTLLAVPIVNVLGFITESRYLPDRRDLNRSFPGSPRGSLASRLAHLLMTEVVSKCQYGIDLHTGTADRTNLPQIRGDLSDEETLRLARAFGAPASIHATARDGSLRAAATAAGNRVLVYEGGEARRFSTDAVERGFEGVLRVIAALGMRDRRARRGGSGDREAPVESTRSTWVRAGRSGLATLTVQAGDWVAKGERLGVVQDAFGEQTLRIRASRNGVVIGLNRQAMVNRGDALVHIAEVNPS